MAATALDRELAAALGQRVGQLEKAVIGLAVVELGDTPGHQFHGNQYSDVGGMGDQELRDHAAKVLAELDTREKAAAAAIERGKQLANAGNQHTGSKGDVTDVFGKGDGKKDKRGVVPGMSKKDEKHLAKAMGKMFVPAASETAEELGAEDGHPFYGNQYTGGGPSSPTDKGGTINRVDAAAKMYGVGSKEHQAAMARYTSGSPSETGRDHPRARPVAGSTLDFIPKDHKNLTDEEVDRIVGPMVKGLSPQKANTILENSRSFAERAALIQWRMASGSARAKEYRESTNRLKQLNDNLAAIDGM